MNRDGAIVEFSRVSFSFPQGAPLFTDLSLALKAGGFYLVQGPSGSGKTTFLRLINRLEEPEAGDIFFRGRALSAYPPPKLRRSVLYIQQTPTVIDGSVRENLLLPFTFAGNQDLPRPSDEGLGKLLADFLLDKVALSDNALTLSVGQMQRLCFLRGLLLSPEVLLLDEPTSALDEESGRIVETMISKLHEATGLTIVMISHKPYDAGRSSPLVLHVAGGRVMEVS